MERKYFEGDEWMLEWMMAGRNDGMEHERLHYLHLLQLY